MTITQAITSIAPAANPATMDRATFSTTAAANVLAISAMTTELNTWAGQANALTTSLNAIAAGTAIGIPYTFSTTTTDADPGAGILRLDNAAQNAATTIRADLSGNDASVWTAVLDTIADSTSTIKGHIRLVKNGDATKWLIFTVSALASPAGYKNITVANVASSAASPFTNGDNIVFEFTRTGDKGDIGNTGATGAGLTSQAVGWTGTLGTTPHTFTCDIDLTASAVIISGGALGTPASATLTNATGLPVNGIVDDTTSALGIGTLELGHASDTTLTRVSAGVAAIEGKTVAMLSAAETFTAAQRGSYTTLTDAATVAVDLALNNFYKVLLAGNRTLGHPTNIVAGQSGQIDVYQDITGSRTLAYAWSYQFAVGTAPVLSTGKLAKDLLCYAVDFYANLTLSAITNGANAVGTSVGHGMLIGSVQKAQFSALVGSTGLAAATNYWLTIVDADTFKFSSSFANAQAATFITTSSAFTSGTLEAATITIAALAGVA